MKRIITLVLAIALIPMTYSCGESKAEKAARIEQEKKVAEERAYRERVEREKKEFEQKTFSTSMGTFYIEQVLQECYQKGVTQGSRYGGPYDGAKYNQFGSESAFKQFFVYNYGIPNNSKAEEVFKQGWDRFSQGWNDGKAFKNS